MDDQFILSDNTDNHGSSSSITSDDDTWKIPFHSIRNSSLSNDDIDKCIYITNINWRQRFSIRLSNDQLNNSLIDQHQRYNSDCSNENSYRNQENQCSYFGDSWWNRSERSLSTFNHQKNCSLLNSRTAYTRLKRLTERLLELERKARETVFQKKCDQQTSLNSIQKCFSSSFTNSIQKRRSSIKNNDQLFTNVKKERENEKEYFHIPIVHSLKTNSKSEKNFQEKNFYKRKIRRIHSYPQLLNQFIFRKVQTMSAIQTSRIESQSSPPSLPIFPISSSRRHSIATTTTTDTSQTSSISVKPNLNNEKVSSTNPEKQVTLEVKINNITRKIHIKTKQEDTICRTKQSLPPQVISSTRTDSSSPHCVQIHQQRRSSISDSSIQSVRVSVSSSSKKDEKIQTKEFEPPSYSSILSNFVQENLVEQTKSDDEGTFDRRPLLNLINELNRQNTFNQPQVVPSIENDQFNQRKTLSPSPTRILPPKQLIPFRPVILHKKYQEPIGRFEFLDKNSSSSPFTRQNSRIGVMRSHTFTIPADVNSNSTKNSSDQTTIRQSTPQLNQSPLLPSVNKEQNSSLLPNTNSLTNTSLANATPTSTGTIDDKYEVYTSY